MTAFLSHCSKKWSSDTFVSQLDFVCLDCAKNTNWCICASCATECHAKLGHRVKAKSWGSSFCDCPADCPCCISSGPSMSDNGMWIENSGETSSSSIFLSHLIVFHSSWQHVLQWHCWQRDFAATDSDEEVRVVVDARFVALHADSRWLFPHDFR